MRQKSGTGKHHADAMIIIKDIRRATRKQYGAKERVCIVLEGLRGEKSVATLRRRELKHRDPRSRVLRGLSSPHHLLRTTLQETMQLQYTALGQTGVWMSDISRQPFRLHTPPRFTHGSISTLS
jgi:hypothetical protein